MKLKKLLDKGYILIYMPMWNMPGYNQFEFMHPNSFFAWGFQFLAPFLLWSLFWKGYALYKAARSEHKGWFIILLIVNTGGILEIVYLLFFAEKENKSSKKKSSWHKDVA